MLIIVKVENKNKLYMHVIKARQACMYTYVATKYKSSKILAFDRYDSMPIYNQERRNSYKHLRT